MTPQLINHEKIHSAQMKELLWIPFYLLYVLEWIFRMFASGFRWYKAYMSISFEKEAYRHGDNLDYLNHRKSFAQWRSTP